MILSLPSTMKASLSSPKAARSGNSLLSPVVLSFLINGKAHLLSLLYSGFGSDLPTERHLTIVGPGTAYNTFHSFPVTVFGLRRRYGSFNCSV